MPDTLSAETKDQLLKVSVSTLTTCLLKRGFRNQTLNGIAPINSDAARMVGPAYTLRFIPSREDLDTMAEYAKDTNVHRRAMEECPEGHVLMIDARGDAGAASGGDIMIARLQKRGGAGAVTDGGFRDVSDISALNFPIYHAAISLPSSPIRHHPADLNQPIGCGGVAVYPGDIVVGDGEGVIVIPAHMANEVAREAAEMTEYENFAAEKVSEGRSIMGLYPSTEESRKEFEAWAGAKRK